MADEASEVTEGDVSGLAAKLEALADSLPEKERALLNVLVGRGLGDAEVEGFAGRGSFREISILSMRDLIGARVEDDMPFWMKGGPGWAKAL